MGIIVPFVTIAVLYFIFMHLKYVRLNKRGTNLANYFHTVRAIHYYNVILTLNKVLNVHFNTILIIWKKPQTIHKTAIINHDSGFYILNVV